MQNERTTRERSPGAFLVPAMMAGFGLVYAYANRNVAASEMRLVTPVTIVLVVSCLVLMVRTWRSGPEPRQPFTRARLARPAGLLAASLILLFGAHIDFPIAAIAFLVVGMFALGVRKPMPLVVVSVLAPILLYVAFTSLGVPLTSFWLDI